MQHVWGGQKRETRRELYSAEINATIDVLLWDIEHPVKGDEHFGYKDKTAAVIYLGARATALQVAENEKPKKERDYSKVDAALSESKICLGEYGFSPAQQQQEIEGICLSLPPRETTAKTLHLVA